MAAARRGREGGREGAGGRRDVKPAEAEGAARMAAGAGGRDGPVRSGEHGPRPAQHDGVRRDGGGDPYWSR